MRGPSLAGLRIGAATALTGLVLDKEQEKLPESEKYLDAVALSFFNLLFVGPVIHAWLAPHLSKRISSFWRVVWKTSGIVLIHSGLYAVIHRCMHRVRAFRYIHAPHHRFSHDVTSSVANAVSIEEFLVAYMFPFVFGAWILHADATSLNMGTCIVSLANLIVHTPHLQNAKYPSFLVHPKEHIEHHRARTRTFAAPTVAWHRVPFIGGLDLSPKKDGVRDVQK